MAKLIGKSLIMAGVCLGALSAPLMAHAQGMKETEASRALVRLDELETQIRDLTNRVEILEAQNQALKGELEQRNGSPDTAPTVANNAAQEVSQPPMDAPAAAQTNEATPAIQTNNQAASVIKQPAQNSVAPTTPAPATSAPIISPAVSAAPKPAVFDANKVLQTAKTKIQAGEYQNAEAILTDFTDNHADDANAPEAFWLLGETRYVQQAWAPAAQAYVAYLNKAPTGPKVPDVLVRIAGAFRELGDNGQRCKALNEYKRRAPNPSAILKARADAEMAKAPCP